MRCVYKDSNHIDAYQFDLNQKYWNLMLCIVNLTCSHACSYYSEKNQIAVSEIVKEAMGRNREAKEDDLKGIIFWTS